MDTILKKSRDLQDFSIINGPSCMYVYEMKEKTFILFSEYHGFNKKLQLNTEEYVASLVNTFKILNFDLYVEADTERVKKGIGPPSDIKKIWSFINTFISCRKGCDNLRFHAVDIRESNEEVREMYSLISYLEDSSDKKSAYDDFKKIIEKVKDYLDDYDYWIRKEINSIENEKIKEYLLNELDILLKEDLFTKNINYLDLIFKEYSEGKVKLSSLQDLADDMTITEYMDLYTVARIFHKYKTFPFESRNVIFYGGGYHTRNLLEYLKAFGAKKVYEYCSENDCVIPPSISLLKDFFFRNPTNSR